MTDSVRNVDVLSTLPGGEDEVIKHILGYVVDARSLLACERSCSALKHVLSDDEVWKYCGGAEAERVESNRENALIECVLNDIRHEQSSFSCRNPLLSVLNPESVQRMTDEVVASGYYVPRSRISFTFRGDSLGCALDMLEAYILGQLQQANWISIHCASKSKEYPILELSDLQLARGIREDVSPSLKLLHFTISKYVDRDDRLMFGSIWDRDIQFQLARRLASRAGIVKITNEAMIEISNHIFSVLMVLLRRPIDLHSSIINRYGNVEEYKEEEAIDLWNDIPPTIFTPCHERSPSGLEYVTRHADNVIVPCQIEESAAELGLPIVNGMYGHRQTWVLEKGQTREQAIKAAKQRYVVCSANSEDDRR